MKHKSLILLAAFIVMMGIGIFQVAHAQNPIDPVPAPVVPVVPVVISPQPPISVERINSMIQSWVTIILGLIGAVFTLMTYFMGRFNEYKKAQEKAELEAKERMKRQDDRTKDVEKKADEAKISIAEHRAACPPPPKVPEAQIQKLPSAGDGF